MLPPQAARGRSEALEIALRQVARALEPLPGHREDLVRALEREATVTQAAREVAGRVEGMVAELAKMQAQVWT